MTADLLHATPRAGVALRIAVAASLAFGLAGCNSIFGGSEEAAVAFSDEPADKLYNEGLFYLKDGDYTEATKKFEEVDKQHPYSDWARKSLIMTTYSKYAQGDYPTAIANARRYLTLHPGSEDAAYAQYLMGMSYYNEIPDISRDQAATARALAALNEVSQRWPNSQYAEEARKRVIVARDQLAGKEMEIGRFYLNQRNYIGAVNRFRTVIENYQTTRHVEEALMRVAEAYMAMGITPEAQTATAVLGHNFPDSPWYKDAHTLVTSGGLEPREDGGSWISKAFRRAGIG